MPADLIEAAGPDHAPSPAARAAGLAALQAAIDAELAPPRRARRWPFAAIGATAAAALAIAVLPGSTPAAAEVLERAAATLDGDGILYVESRPRSESGGEVQRFGTRRVWLRDGDTPELRWQQVAPDGTVTEYRQVGRRLQVYDARTGRLTGRDGWMSPGEVVRARALVQGAGPDADLAEVTLDGRAAYRLTWDEPSPPGHRVTMTLWVDRETYAPLRFTDRGVGTGPDGPYDTTYTEDVTRVERLPDTAENRRLLVPGTE